MDKTYAMYVAEDKEHRASIMAKYGAGTVPKSYDGDTSYLNTSPAVVVQRPAIVQEPPTPAVQPGPVVQLALAL